MLGVIAEHVDLACVDAIEVGAREELRGAPDDGGGLVAGEANERGIDPEDARVLHGGGRAHERDGERRRREVSSRDANELGVVVGCGLEGGDGAGGNRREIGHWRAFMVRDFRRVPAFTGLRRRAAGANVASMKLSDIPFQAIDWAAIAPTEHRGVSGQATWRTVEVTAFPFEGEGRRPLGVVAIWWEVLEA